MKATIVTTIIGCFGVSEDKKIINYVEFPKDVEKIVELLEQSKTKTIKQEKEIEAALKKEKFTEIEKGKSSYITSNLRELAIEEKFVKNPVEFNRFATKINTELAKKEIKKAIGRDQLVMQANNSIEELDKSINIMVERLREWYGLHFPEMERAVDDHKKFAKLIEKFGSRKDFEHPDLSHFKEKSMGADFEKDDIKIMQSLAAQILDLYKIRDAASDYMDKLLKEVAPNLRDVAGPVLAAKLISLAGGLKKLARMPSSTIQLLGAEKALFRHLHGRGKSPKHGIIVNHQYVKNAQQKDRGKIARLLSAKFSIAAKMDFFSKTYKGKELKKELERKIKEISKSK
jgi:nucleolar protein 56